MLWAPESLSPRTLEAQQVVKDWLASKQVVALSMPSPRSLTKSCYLLQ